MIYKNYKINLIKHPYDKDDEDDDLDEKIKDELQILSESNEILFTYLEHEIFSYEMIDSYLIVKISDGYKFSLDYVYINLDGFVIHHQLIKKFYDKYKHFYSAEFDNENKKIIFEDTQYDIDYFFSNESKIIDDYEYERYQFNTEDDTLLKAIFNVFGKNVDNNSQIKIRGFTFGMSCQDVGYFKLIKRDHTKTIERQLFEVLFGHTIERNMKIYDIDLTINYKDNGEDKSFRFILECRDKEPIQIGDETYFYGYFDDNAKLEIV
jgi:hypothetical protein